MNIFMEAFSRSLGILVAVAVAIWFIWMGYKLSIAIAEWREIRQTQRSDKFHKIWKV